MNRFFWLVGLIIGLLALLLATAIPAYAAQNTSSASAESEESVTSNEFALAYGNKICFGGVTVHAFDIDRAVRAGLIEDVYPIDAEGNFTPAHPHVSWGECVLNGSPTSHTRLTNVSPALYLTQCDANSSIGGMRITYALIDGVQEPNVVYLHYGVDDDPCEGGMLFITESNNDWQEACFVQPLSLVIDPTGRSSFDMGHAPVQYRCDPVLGR